MVRDLPALTHDPVITTDYVGNAAPRITPTEDELNEVRREINNANARERYKSDPTYAKYMCEIT